MDLEDLRIYKDAMSLGDEVWSIADKWNYFQKDTIGKQLVKAADSVAANISEGFGRFHYKDSKNFNYYSRGSLYETKTWLAKGYSRKLLSKDQFDSLTINIETLARMLNSYIKKIGQANEPVENYNPMTND